MRGFLAPARRARQRLLVGVVDLALDDVHAAGAAGAAAAAGADDAHAAAAGGLKNRLARRGSRSRDRVAGKPSVNARRRRMPVCCVRHDAALKRSPAPSTRPDILHFGAEGQSSQRDQRAGGKSMPMPSTIDIDLSGCSSWPCVTRTPIVLGAGQTQHGRLRLQRQARIARPQFAGRGQAALCAPR